MNKIEREKVYHNKAFAEDVRKETDKFYSIARSSRKHYTDLLQKHGEHKKVLEYGCGPGSSAFMLAKLGATVQGIDISEVAIDRASSMIGDKDLNIKFSVMNAEELEFNDDSFDLICGSGILHHLQFDKAYAELSRTLMPEGRAVFLEPLGHNVLINTYRKLTPNLRTDDEHPLMIRDIDLAYNHFSKVETTFFHLSSLGTYLFRNSPIFSGLLGFSETFDRALFDLIPFFKKYAWAVVIVLSNSTNTES